MDKSTSEVGVITAVIERLVTQKLPRLQALEAKLDKGEPLNDSELEFLEQVSTDGNEVMRMIDRHPEYHDLAAKVLELCTKIISKAVDVEKGE